MKKENYQSSFGMEKGNVQWVFGRNEDYVQEGES